MDPALFGLKKEEIAGDASSTRATRVKVERFLRETRATMWIQHDPPTYATLRKAPGFYD